MLSLESLTVARGGRPIIDALSLQLPAGQIVGLIGANGAGKSTLIQAIAGLLPATGTVHWQGAAVDLRRLGYLPQTATVRARLTVLETVLLGLQEELGWRLADGLIDRAQAELKRFRIDHLHRRPMQTLSGGQQQLVLLAQKLVRRPGLLLLDEATSALDICHQMRVFQRLEDYVATTGALVLVAIHDLNVAARFAQTLLLLGSGQLLAQGTAATVLTPAVLARAYGINAEILRTPQNRLAIIPICPCEE